MSQQGPILVISHAPQRSLVGLLDEAKLFPLIETDWAEAARAVNQVEPSAVLVAMSQSGDADLTPLAARIAARKLYTPLIAVEPAGPLAPNAIPFIQGRGSLDRLLPRLRAALRVRALHATVLRRLADEATAARLPQEDPLCEATVLLMGRGGSYPALSVALGERMSIAGALGMEAAGKQLNSRGIDGIVLSEGFTSRVVDAFLTVLSEDARFRNLPVILTTGELAPRYKLPNLEILIGEPGQIAINAAPLIRQHALEARLSRTLRAIDAGGRIDPQTGLLTPAAFDREFATAVRQTLAAGGGLSAARLAFEGAHARAQLDGARIISHMMRQMDFGTMRPDQSVVVVFAETDLRAAHTIARRLSSVIRQTSHGAGHARFEPVLSVATLQPSDTASSLLARLDRGPRRAVS
ncbi:GGDEF domain-containing protein [Bradyrhizobium sp.]|uniref:GGDEF domain-containing protein n=1 Tax=Bradyrhizobium sp. TaxID=376 RepID=UPI001EB83422|nr:GGDEF domain-containing protein [Bradyrhizobium sp.]MBV9984447.1 GGDEF domain-containing protein [Bradyrhizobium sp.]